MRTAFLLMACLFGFCFGEMNPKCHEWAENTMSLLRKGSQEKNKAITRAGLLFGHDIDRFNCSCLEKIDCGAGEPNVCTAYKCEQQEKTVSIFNAADIQRFIVIVGNGEGNSGVAGQP